LLADRDVDAADLLGRVTRGPVVLLVDDRVDRDRALAGLPVAADQLPLAAADRGHRVDRLDAGLQRLLDRLPLHHRRRLDFQGALRGALDRAEAVERLAERADHAAEEPVADRHGEDLAGPLDRLALFDLGVLTQDDDTDLTDVQVQREPADAVLKLEQLVRHARGQALDPGDTVAALGDRADFLARGAGGLGLFDEPR